MQGGFVPRSSPKPHAIVPAHPLIRDGSLQYSSNKSTKKQLPTGLAIGLALGGCLLVAMLGAAVFVWHRKRRMQPPQSGASNAAPQQVEVTVTQPESK